MEIDAPGKETEVVCFCSEQKLISIP